MIGAGYVSAACFSESGSRLRWARPISYSLPSARRCVAGDRHAALSFVFKTIGELAPHLDGFTVIATKSTVPVGPSREIERRLKQLRPDPDFAVCSNPEFLREGSAIYGFTHPDRVLVGCDEERARLLMERLYKPLALRNAPVMFV